ncbi:MAG: glycosyltransferase [Chloroflexi bacterium]|nr:glycosyltransferase [Chloroflexota bacterium]
MNILYLCADPGIPIRGTKGAAIHVRAMIDALSARGHSITLLTPRAGQGVEPNARVVEIAMPPTNTLSSEERETLAMQNADALYRAGLALKFDLIYERYSLWSDAGARLARATGAPLVVEVNAPLRIEAARYRALQRAEDAQAIEQRVFAQADLIAVVSSPLRAYVIAHGARAERARVLPNAVDEKFFHPAVTGDAMRAQLGLTDKFVIGFVGTVKPWHDLDTLIDAVARTPTPSPAPASGRGVHLLLVGDIPDAVRAQIAQRGIAATIVPPVPNHDVPAYIAAMDVAVSPHPALADFYFSPLKLFEYLACGVATIAADLPPIAEVVHDGVNARLYPPGDSAALAAQIAELAANDAARRSLGWNGASYVLQNHTWSRNAAQMLGWIFPHRLANTISAAPLFDDKLRRKLYRATRADIAGDLLSAQIAEKFDALTRLEILKYKPRRRCVIAYDLTDRASRVTPIIGKVFRDDRGAHHFEFQRALWQDGFGVHARDGMTIARPLAYISEMQMFVQERAPGQTLEELVNAPEFIERVQQSAAVIAKLHATMVAPPKTYTRADELAQIAAWTRDLVAWKPKHAADFTRQHTALRAWADTLPRAELAPAHRDFYYSQLLFTAQRVTLIDLDLFARADPALDVANFAAHLRFLALDHFNTPRALDAERALFIEEYTRRTKVAPEFFARLAFYEAATYYRLLHVVLTRPQFVNHFDALFEIVEQTLTQPAAIHP